MSKAAESLLALLERHPLFNALERDAREHIVADGTEIHLDDGELLYQSGERADRVFVLLNGALQIEYPLRGTTRGRVTAVLLAPGFLGECQVLNERTWTGTGIAVTELVALGIRTTRFVELTAKYPRLTQALYFELTIRFLNAIESWRQEPASKPEHQVARYLLARSEVLAHLDRPADLIAVRQVELARATGLRPETVNRILAKWKKSGIVGKEGENLKLTGSLQEAVLDETTTPLIQRCMLPQMFSRAPRS